MGERVRRKEKEIVVQDEFQKIKRIRGGVARAGYLLILLQFVTGQVTEKRI